MRIPILRGRDVTDADNLRAPGVVVINDYLARRYWPGEDAIGKRITFDDPAKNPSWLTVVGVAKNTVRSNWVESARGRSISAVPAEPSLISTLRRHRLPT